MTVKIYKLNRAFEFYIWLCDRHAEQREAAGFQVKGLKAVDWELPCQDCRDEAADTERVPLP